MISTLNKLINRFSYNCVLPQLSSKLRHFSSADSSVDKKVYEKEINNFYRFERNFEELSVDTFRGIITDKTIEDKVSMILSEYEYEKYTTLRVPSTLTVNQMKDLLTCRDSQDRRHWFNYLFKRQNARSKSDVDRKKHSEEYWQQKNQIYSKTPNQRTGIWDSNGELVYGLWHNTIFSKILRNSVNRFYSHRLRRAALFGPKVIVDLDYDKYMKLHESRLLARQLQLLHNWNRYHSIEPFDLHFTNCDPNMPTLQQFKRLLQTSESNIMSDFHQKSYTDLFPKERLVYLSPHADSSLKTFDIDDIYIMGGIIDKSYHKPISYIKATKEGIRCAKLPIDEHIIWKSGTKSLCLTHTFEILHDVYITGDIGKALRDRIPKRKQKGIDQIEYEDMLRKQKINRLKKFNPKTANNYF